MRPSWSTRPRIISRNSAMPAGSSPLLGSSRMSSSGSLSSARVDAQPLAHAQRVYRDTRSWPRASRPTRESTAGMRAPRVPVEQRRPRLQVLPAREVGVEPRLLDHAPHPAQRPDRVGGHVHAPHPRRPGGGRARASSIRMSVVLAGPVGTEGSRSRCPPGPRGPPPDREALAEALGEGLRLDDRGASSRRSVEDVRGWRKHESVSSPTRISRGAAAVSCRRPAARCWPGATSSSTPATCATWTPCARSGPSGRRCWPSTATPTTPACWRC